MSDRFGSEDLTSYQKHALNVADLMTAIETAGALKWVPHESKTGKIVACSWNTWTLCQKADGSPSFDDKIVYSYTRKVFGIGLSGKPDFLFRLSTEECAAFEAACAERRKELYGIPVR